MDFQGKEKKMGHEKRRIDETRIILLLWVQHKSLCQLCGVDTKLKEKLFIGNL